MGVPTARINGIALNISSNHKQRVIMSAHIQTVALADGKELSAVMRAYDFAPRISFETRLLNVLASRTVSLGDEFDCIVKR